MKTTEPNKFKDFYPMPIHSCLNHFFRNHVSLIVNLLVDGQIDR